MSAPLRLSWGMKTLKLFLMSCDRSVVPRPVHLWRGDGRELYYGAQVIGAVTGVFHFVGRDSTILFILPFNSAFLWEASCQSVRVKGPLFR